MNQILFLLHVCTCTSGIASHVSGTKERKGQHSIANMEDALCISEILVVWQLYVWSEIHCSVMMMFDMKDVCHFIAILELHIALYQQLNNKPFTEKLQQAYDEALLMTNRFSNDFVALFYCQQHWSTTKGASLQEKQLNLLFIVQCFSVRFVDNYTNRDFKSLKIFCCKRFSS